MKQGKKQKVEFSLDTIRKNPGTRKQLEGFIEEIELLRGEIKRAQVGVRDIMTEAKDALGIPGKILNKLVKEHMSPGTIEADIEDLESVQQLAEAIENGGVVVDPNAGASA
jgi:uncharacterized protein (UPF0335 family)